MIKLPLKVHHRVADLGTDFYNATIKDIDEHILCDTSRVMYPIVKALGLDKEDNLSVNLSQKTFDEFQSFLYLKGIRRTKFAVYQTRQGEEMVFCVDSLTDVFGSIPELVYYKIEGS